MRRVLCAAFSVLGIVPVSVSAESTIPVFQPLGGVGGGTFFISEAHGISPDGRVVLGRVRGTPQGNAEAAYWTCEAGWVVIGDLPGGDFNSRATASSKNGSIIVGAGRSENGREAFVWTAEGGIKGLGDLPGGIYFSEALGVSADGSVVVGQGYSGDTEAFRWQAETGMQGLGFLPGGERYSIAYDISADGSTITGYSKVPFRQGGAFRWTALEGMLDLGDFGALPAGQLQMLGKAISADGATIAGSASGFPGFGFRWNLENGYETFDVLGGGGLGSLGVHGTSGDGTVIVGASSTAVGNEALVWDPIRGASSIRDILESDYDVDLAGWTLYLAADVSDDGRVIVGAGVNPDGLREGWVVTFPIDAEIDIKPHSPINRINPASHGLVPVAILGSSTFNVSQVDASTLEFGAEAAAPLHDVAYLKDVNNDGFTDLVARYRIDETGIASGDTESCLVGETFDARPFRGCDSLVTVGVAAKASSSQ